MKLYYSPGACSMGIHIVLEEIGASYELVKLDLRAGEQHRPPFSEINPKGKVPTLIRDDGMVLTEYPVIARYLAETHATSGLLPLDTDEALQSAAAMDYCVSTLHMQGFARLFRPENFAPGNPDAAKEQGRQMVEQGFGIMSKMLGTKEYVAGSFSLGDTALFYVEFWGFKRMAMTLPGNLGAHLDRMLARPAVQRMLAQEGLTA